MEPRLSGRLQLLLLLPLIGIIVGGGAILWVSPMGGVPWIWSIFSLIDRSYWAVLLLGAVVGMTELLARYKDAPLRALLTIPGLFYITVNSLAGPLALYLIGEFKVIDDAAKAKEVTRVLLAGFGAMAFFRSAIFTARVGNTDISIGPAGFLQTLLASIDRAVDRKRAAERATIASDVMKDVSFDLARTVLPGLCFSLMQNVRAEEETAFGAVIQEIVQADMKDFQKSYILGLRLMNIVGEKVLKNAVQELGNDIKAVSSDTMSRLSALDFSLARTTLRDMCFSLAQGIADEKMKDFDEFVKNIDHPNTSNAHKSRMLGLRLARMVGEKILRQAMETLGTEINARKQPIVTSLETISLLPKINFEEHGQSLINICVINTGQTNDSAISERLKPSLKVIGEASVDQRDKSFLLVQKLLSEFGEEVVNIALKMVVHREAGSKPAGEPGNGNATREPPDEGRHDANPPSGT